MNLYTSLSILFFLAIGHLASAVNPEPPELFLQDFAVYNVEEEIILEWFTNKEDDIKHFVIERATGESKFFKQIGKIRVMQNEGYDAVYLFSDEEPDLHNHYRVKIVLNNGITLTSSIVKAYSDSEIGKESFSDELKNKG